jgi:hypothetical protein
VNKLFWTVAGLFCVLAIPAVGAVQLALAAKVPEHLSYRTDPARSASPTLATVCEGKIEPRMRLFVGRASRSKPFVAVSYVRSLDPLQTVTLHVPKGLALMDGESPTKLVGPMGPKGGYATIRWRLQASQQGQFKLIAVGVGLPPATETVRVRGYEGIFD